MLSCICSVVVSENVVNEIKRIILDSEILKEDDHLWPEPDRVGRQELEVKLGNEHIHFTVMSTAAMFGFILFVIFIERL